MSAASDQDDLLIVCPCCRTRLTVHAASGEILHEERPAKAETTWDGAVAASERKRNDAEALFERGIERELNADDILERKFREAMKRADKSDAPPPRIFDLD